MKRVQPIRVVVVEKHVRLMFGQTLMHSEEYASPAGARRAARNLIKAINTRPMRLEYLKKGSWAVEMVRKLWWVQSHGNVALPVDPPAPEVMSVRMKR